MRIQEQLAVHPMIFSFRSGDSDASFLLDLYWPLPPMSPNPCMVIVKLMYTTENFLFPTDGSFVHTQNRTGLPMDWNMLKSI